MMEAPNHLFPSGIEIRAVQPRNRLATKKPQGSFQVDAQYFQRSCDTGGSRGSKTIRVGASNKDRTGSKADCFDNVGTATDASVHEHFDFASNRVYDFGKDVQRRRSAVELPSTMIRDHHRHCPVIHRSPGIFASENTLDHNGPAACAKAAPTSRRGSGSCPGTMTFGSTGTPPSRRRFISQRGRTSTCGKNGILV